MVMYTRVIFIKLALFLILMMGIGFPQLVWSNSSQTESSKKSIRKKLTPEETAIKHCTETLRTTNERIQCATLLSQKFWKNIKANIQLDSNFYHLIQLKTKMGRDLYLGKALKLYSNTEQAFFFGKSTCMMAGLLSTACLKLISLDEPKLKNELDGIRLEVARDQEEHCIRLPYGNGQSLKCFLSLYQFNSELNQHIRFPRPTTEREATEFEQNCLLVKSSRMHRFSCYLAIYEWWRDVSGYYRNHNVVIREQRDILFKMIKTFPHPDTLKQLAISKSALKDVPKAREREKKCDGMQRSQEKFNCYSELSEFWTTGGGAGMISWNVFYETARLGKKMLQIMPQDFETISETAHMIWSIDVDRVRAKLTPPQKDVSSATMDFFKEMEKLQTSNSLFEFYDCAVRAYWLVYAPWGSIAKFAAREKYRNEANRLLNIMESLAQDERDQSKLNTVLFLRKKVNQPLRKKKNGLQGTA